jgi:DNA repair protein RecN (Recombination protein N)
MGRFSHRKQEIGHRAAYPSPEGGQVLTELNIKNFAIIDELTISFHKGLNVLSGETGAGKSIIIGAVSLILGDRASADMIRSSEDTATVEALFDISGHRDLKNRLAGMGELAGDELVVKRIVSRSGKNRVYINGGIANLNTLSVIGEPLINICSQHEHQLILDQEYHIDILDEFGGLLPLRRQYGDVYDEVQSLKSRLQELETFNRHRAEREELLRFQVREIEDAALYAGEEEALVEEKKVLGNVQKLMDHAGRAYESIYGKEGSVLQELKDVIANIREVRKIDESLTIGEKEMDSLYFQLEDAALILRDYTHRLFYDPVRLEAIGERQDLIGKLKRKYGPDIPSILERKKALDDELTGIAVADEELATLAGKLEDKVKQLREKAGVLSGKRHGAAKDLAKAIEKEIHVLRMGEARFEVVFKKREEGTEMLFNAKGIDDVEFYLSTNIGENLKPLNRIASGGELSRIVLAMKKVLAGVGAVGTIIFDEVDSGIGGATAQVVGEKIRDVAGHHQVLCITHLPQIACFADRHYRVSKAVSGNRTTTSVVALTYEEQLEEIARMLGGIEVTETTRKHAREMLARSRRKVKDA